jgi:hypothetical protein
LPVGPFFALLRPRSAFFAMQDTGLLRPASVFAIVGGMDDAI